jgi:hypothetical protein
MKRCIFNLGPMYVHYEGAENPAFANYPRQGGIIGNYVYNGPPQFGNKLLHSMVIIGWGKDTKRGGIEFWWVKNSYKEGWGLSNSKTGLTNLIKMKMKDPDGPDIFHSRFAIINYREECDSVQALLTLKRAPFIIKGDGVVLLNFDAYRIDPKTQDFLLTCQVLQAPAPYNITSVNTSPAQVDSNGNIKQGGMIVTDTDSKYWIPEGTRLIRSNSRDGTRFKGTIGLDGIPNGLKFPLVNHPQYGPLYKWRVSLSVINKITKNKIKEDIFEIIWDYAK